jgi:hypothetical protein
MAVVANAGGEYAEEWILSVSTMTPFSRGGLHLRAMVHIVHDGFLR